MISVTEFRSATPILASLDIARTVAFYETKLGFTTLYAAQNEYAVLRKDSIGLHFWACQDPAIAEATSLSYSGTGNIWLIRTMPARKNSPSECSSS